MVERLSASGIQDPSVLHAFLEIPRHLFVEEALMEKAYGTHSLPIGFGQTISQPEIVARMSEMVQIRPEERVLEVGTGSGYQAAILWVDGARFRAGCALEQGRRRPATEWPINRALRGIGGGRDANNDEFLMIGLGRYRSCADIVAGVPDYPV